MPTCQCGRDLPGRRRKCDDCKKRPGGQAPPEPPPPPYPAGLHDRGRKLWDGIGQTLDTPAGQLALEACRLADRLDVLDRAVAGRGLVDLAYEGGYVHDEERTVVLKVEITGLLTELRLQETAFKGILVQLAELKVKTAKGPAPAGKRAGPSAEGGAAAPAPSATPLNELEARRRRREQEA